MPSRTSPSLVIMHNAAHCKRLCFAFLCLLTLPWTQLIAAPPAAPAPPLVAACESAAMESDAKATLAKCTQAISALRRNPKSRSDHLANMYEHLGQAEMRLKEHAKAESSFRSAYAVRLSNHGNNHKDLVRPLTLISESLLLQGKANTAEPLLLKALDIQEKTSGQISEATAKARHSLGMLYAHQNKSAQAEQHFRQEIATLDRLPNSNPADKAVAHNNLGILLHRNSKREEAERQYRKAIELLNNAGPNEETRLTDPLLNLAILSTETNRHADAEESLLRLLAIRDKINGIDSSESADVHNRLGVLYSQADIPQKAEQAFLKALQLREKRHGSNHLLVAETASNLGLLRMRQRKLLEALPLLRHAAAVTQVQTGGQGELAKARWVSLENLYSLIMQQQPVTTTEASSRQAPRGK